MSNKQWEIGSIIGLDDVIRWDGKVSPTELEQVINQLRAGEITVAEAQKWAESITLTLAGDARGSVNIDGSGNVSLTVTVNKATQAEAETGENNTRFMTPLRTKQLVDASGLAKGSDLNSHVENKGNPHNVTKTQIGLGNVDNVRQATKTEFDSHVADKSNPHSITASQVGAYSKTESDGRFETPTGAQQKVNAHADLTDNPHGVTKAQVGLGSVPNYSMASQAEAEAGTSNARFMSPQRTKEAIDVHANSTNNPHSVTKTQVGLGSVPNYGVSTQAEAETGTANNRFMTPLRVKEAFDKFIETVSTALNNFIARRDNPHQVTKSQVGLGNVDNVQQAPATRTISTGTGLTGGGNLTANRTIAVDIATASEAQAGTNNTKVMTPARSKALLDTHANSTNNPHAVTKAQVGLGSVPNYSMASQAEAEAGQRSNLFMTPFLTRRAIEYHALLKTGGTLTGEIQFRPAAGGGSLYATLFPDGRISSLGPFRFEDGLFSKQDILTENAKLTTGGTVEVNAIDHNGAGRHLYGRPMAGGEFRITERGTTTDYLPLRASGFRLDGGVSLTQNSILNDYQGLFVGSGTGISNMGGGNATVRIGTTVFNGTSTSSGLMYLGRDGTGERIWAHSIYSRTYSGAANMFITQEGTLGRSTSASKYKLNIDKVNTKPLEDKILNLMVKSWNDKVSTESYADYLTRRENGEEEIEPDVGLLKRHYGLIAEDLVDAGLDMFVQYGKLNEDGTREVEGIEYDRLWVLLIPIVKRLNTELEELKK